MELSESQLQIAEQIIDRNVIRTTLAGLAGTGKTTVLKYLYDRIVASGRDVCVLAPTGKAAMVLRAKGVPAITVHTGLYHYKGQFENLRGEIELVFKDNKKGKFCDVLMVDEGSMLTKKMVEDIEARETQTIFSGDPGQLKPVKSPPNGLFVKPDFTLKEIHRQAAESPIIKFAYALRKGTSLANSFPGIKHIQVRGRGPIFVASQMIDNRIDRLIVKSNAQRVAINRAYRGITDRRGCVAVNDEIICINNNKYLDIVNGEIFKVLEVSDQEANSTRVKVRNVDTGWVRSVLVWNAQFGQERKLEEEIGQEFGLFDWAYAMTCHKFQGSSARHIGIAARSFGDADPCWNYTAATRAEQDLTVFA